MSHLSQNLERLIQMISIEQLLGLVKQNNTSSDILTTPIVQKVVKAYEDELQTLNSVTNQNACVKDYSEDIAKIHEQLAAINSNLLHLADAIKNIHISTNVGLSYSEAKVTNEVAEEANEVDKSSSKAEETNSEAVANEVDKSSVASLEVVASLEEEHVRLKIEEKQVTTVNESDDESSLASLEEVEVASLEAEEEEEEEAATVASSSVAEEEESEKEISDDEVEEEEVADASSVEEVEEESVATVASLEEVESEEEVEESEKEISDEESEEEAKSSNAVEEEEEEVFEIEIDDVTYYATSEENGILYEVDADGEVGKKVGIIKDGEPIFS
jgi:hypothetical protein